MLKQLPSQVIYYSTFHRPPVSFNQNAPGTATLDAWKQRYRSLHPTLTADDLTKIKFGFFAVNMEYDESLLIEEFRRHLFGLKQNSIGWLPSTLPPIPKAPPTKHPGRTGIGDALRALGAMRLCYHYGGFAAAKRKLNRIPIEEKRHHVFYEHLESYRRARNSVVRHFQTLFGQLDSEKPIHYKTWNRNSKSISALAYIPQLKSGGFLDFFRGKLQSLKLLRRN
jgi:hypothetical protein